MSCFSAGLSDWDDGNWLFFILKYLVCQVLYLCRHTLVELPHVLAEKLPQPRSTLRAASDQFSEAAYESGIVSDYRVRDDRLVKHFFERTVRHLDRLLVPAVLVYVDAQDRGSSVARAVAASDSDDVARVQPGSAPDHHFWQWPMHMAIDH